MHPTFTYNLLLKLKQADTTILSDKEQWISVSCHIEWNIIAFTNFLLFWDQIEFSLVPEQMKQVIHFSLCAFEYH